MRRGIPRLTRTVARFEVAPPRRPRGVARVRVRGGTLTWQRARGAASYDVAVVRPDRTTSLHSARRPRLPLRSLPRRGRITVQIVALDGLDRPGPLTTVRLRLGKRG